jgi:anti-anti-sigma factor
LIHSAREETPDVPQTASFALREEAPEAGTFVITVEGEADMSTAVKFNESFFSAARSGVRRVIADLSEVSFVDTTMLNAMVVGHRRMTRDHGCFAVVCGPRVSRILEITGLGQILDVFGSREDALAHVRQSSG